MRIFQTAIFSLSLLFVLPGSNLAGNEALTLEEIIERYTNTIGGYENIKNIENIVYSDGLYQEEGYTGSGQSMMSIGRTLIAVAVRDTGRMVRTPSSGRTRRPMGDDRRGSFAAVA